MTLEHYEQAFIRVCFDAEPSDADLDALGDRARYLLYRDMVRGRLREMAEHALPRTRTALGAERFAALFEEHLAVEPPRSRFIREVVVPFAGWLVGRVSDEASTRPWLADLISLERARWEAIWRDRTVEPPTAEFDFDRRPVVSPVHELLAVEHAVHREPDEHGAYPAEPAWVIVYRRPSNHVVGTFGLNAVTAELVRAWARSEETAMESVQRVAALRGVAVDAAFIDGLCTVLAEFIEREIVLGSR